MEFEEFARAHTGPGNEMNIVELRDHAAGMLATIALDMEQYQSDADQERKSKGQDRDDPEGADTAAERHGTDRADSGFSLEEMISEYRALRATVLRLWEAEHGDRDRDREDVIRFNEAIDMAMTESLPTFTARLNYAREMFLAVLGHDLRTPLSAVIMASSYLTTDGGLTGRNLTLAQQINSSGRRMDSLVSDLVDITRSHLGRDLPVTPEEIDLADIVREAQDEIQSAYPNRELRLEVSGNVRGKWDPSRMHQALMNLMGNAIQHGDGTAIVLTARGDADDVVVSVHNRGRVITPEERDLIFEPFERLEPAVSGRLHVRGSGLGLYIVRLIALAHGGTVDVRSTAEEGTTFELQLPRRVPTARNVTIGMS